MSIQDTIAEDDQQNLAQFYALEEFYHLIRYSHLILNNQVHYYPESERMIVDIFKTERVKNE